MRDSLEPQTVLEVRLDVDVWRWPRRLMVVPGDFMTGDISYLAIG